MYFLHYNTNLTTEINDLICLMALLSIQKNITTLIIISKSPIHIETFQQGRI